MTTVTNFGQWAAVPGGAVELSAGGYLTRPAQVAVLPFFISRYPVTNAQYELFIEAGGYLDQAFWSPGGWRLRCREDWTMPRFWDDSQWNQPDCPVVGVSWYEAMAYCAWLSRVLGRVLTLPTEAQWQRAAQGGDSRPFPWGFQDPTAELCNWDRFFDQPTPVDWYPAGASPFGVMGMSGNVWEYCLNGYRTGAVAADGSEPRLLRGGSWSSDSPISLTVANRSGKDPNVQLPPGYRHHPTVGFRPAAK